MRTKSSARKRFGVLAGVLVLSCSRSQAPAPQAAPILETAPTTAGADAGAAHETKAPTLDSKESRTVAKTLTKVSKLRGLEATKPVPGETLERIALAAKVKDKALREYPPEALKREGSLLELMGFAPAGFDYLGETIKMLEAQLAGFYEPQNGTMYLAGDLSGADAKATLAHELVHALQDQHWDLKARSGYRPGRSDETMALACLAEGDATSAMLDYLMAPDKSALDMSDTLLRGMMQSGMSFKDLETVPHVLKSSLVAPYVEGLGFIHALRRKGGWSEVDRAWQRMPTTTEQILHADKWRAGEAALTIPTPSGAALGEGYVRSDEDTTGELGFVLNFAEWMDVDDARLAAAGWGGDKSAVWTKGDAIAYAVHLRYDPSPTKGNGAPNAVGDDAFAKRAMSKLSPALKKSLGTPSIATSDAICFDRKDLGPLMFARKDRDVVMIVGPARTSPNGWQAEGTCATSKAWADEIAAQK